jgi:glycosyltransferase involved in cell wall biosynthesis
MQSETEFAVVAAEIRDYFLLEPILEIVPAPKLSLIIPAFNERSRIGETLETAWAYLRAQPYDFEILLSDDGSTDDTRAIAESFERNHECTRVISIAHGGKAAAIRAGMKAATGRVVIFTDADLATPISYIGDFLAAIDQGADVVIGSREGVGANRVGEPIYRHLMGRAFNRLVQTLVLPGINDTQCGFKAFTRFAAQEIVRRSRLYADHETISGARVTAFDVEMLVIARKLGLKIVEMPVIWTYGDQSKVNPLRDTVTNVRDILQVKYNSVRHAYE